MGISKYKTKTLGRNSLVMMREWEIRYMKDIDEYSVTLLRIEMYLFGASIKYVESKHLSLVKRYNSEI